MAWDPRASGLVPSNRSGSDIEAHTSVELMARDLEREVAKRTVTASVPPPPNPPSSPAPALAEPPVAPLRPAMPSPRRATPVTMPSLRPAPPVREDDEVAAALALFSEGAAPHESPLQRARRLGLGKETLAVLAPTMVRRVARSTTPPPMKLRVTRELVLALALMIAVLSSASVALALH